MKEEIIQLSNGCICCTLRGDLLKSIARLCKDGSNEIDYIIIESSGIAEPMMVAETFALDVDSGTLNPGGNDDLTALSSIARLDTCVTVIDVSEFQSQADSICSIAESTGEGKNEEEGEKTISNLLLEQLEFANVIVLNKTDLVSELTLKTVANIVRKLNPKANIITSCHSKVGLSCIINTKLFSMAEAETSAGWLHDLKGLTIHTPETIEFGISSFVYKARLPFHPAKIHAWINRYFITEADKQRSVSLEQLHELGVARKNTLVSEIGWIIR